jgi:hypothetical protein
MGRFINADALVSTGQGILSNNMFAYCNNNPVNKADYSGAVAEHIIYPVCFGGNGPQNKQSLTQDEEYMIDAGLEFGVDPAMIATVIAVEQNCNVNIFDLADIPVGLIGIDMSVGYGQVRISTAKMLEETGYIESSGSHCDRVWRLADRKTNIRYVAAYLAYVRDIWILQDQDFEEHPDIWWTVYNTGRISAHPNPQPGLLAVEAGAFYSYYHWLFG